MTDGVAAWLANGSVEQLLRATTLTYFLHSVPAAADEATNKMHGYGIFEVQKVMKSRPDCARTAHRMHLEARAPCGRRKTADPLPFWRRHCHPTTADVQAG